MDDLNELAWQVVRDLVAWSSGPLVEGSKRSAVPLALVEKARRLLRRRRGLPAKEGAADGR